MRYLLGGTGSCEVFFHMFVFVLIFTNSEIEPVGKRIPSLKAPIDWILEELLFYSYVLALRLDTGILNQAGSQCCHNREASQQFSLILALVAVASGLQIPRVMFFHVCSGLEVQLGGV